MCHSKAVIYLRKNTDVLTGKAAIKKQKAALKAYCLENNIKIKATYTDYLGKIVTERPQFKQLLKHLKAKKGKIDYVLFTNTSRLSRNFVQAFSMLEQIKKCSVIPKAIEAPINTIQHL